MVAQCLGRSFLLELGTCMDDPIVACLVVTGVCYQALLFEKKETKEHRAEAVDDHKGWFSTLCPSKY